MIIFIQKQVLRPASVPRAELRMTCFFSLSNKKQVASEHVIPSAEGARDLLFGEQ